MERILEVPACPESISTPDGREAWMDICSDLIERKKLTPETLEVVKACCFSYEIGNIAEQSIMKSNNDKAVQEIYTKCSNHMLECSEVLGLTPKDRGWI